MTSPTPVCVEIQFQIKPALEEEFFRQLTAFSHVVASEPECLEFRIYRDMADKAKFRVSETWVSLAHFETVQMAKDYYPPYFEKVRDMWAVPIQMTKWAPLVAHQKAD